MIKKIDSEKNILQIKIGWEQPQYVLMKTTFCILIDYDALGRWGDLQTER